MTDPFFQIVPSRFWLILEKVQKPEQVEFIFMFYWWSFKQLNICSQIDQFLSCSTYAKIDPRESKFSVEYIS